MEGARPGSPGEGPGPQPDDDNDDDDDDHDDVGEGPGPQPDFHCSRDVQRYPNVKFCAHLV